jgi:hypothetical protein
MLIPIKRIALIYLELFKKKWKSVGFDFLINECVLCENDQTGGRAADNEWRRF